MFHSLLAKGTPEVVTTVTLDMCKKALTDMTPAMRAMFPHVEVLFRLLLVNPASSASAERSFNSLRRPKTYLRSTCGKRRLNSIALCHVHKHLLARVDLTALMKEFIACKDSRYIIFGKV